MSSTSGDLSHHDEIRHHFDVLMAGLLQGMVRMGALVTENTRRAGEAMTENRLDLVKTVRKADAEVNSMYATLERQTFETLARQQPVASDLRFLVATTRILYELERSGDLAVNCVNVLERENGFPGSAALRSLVGKLVTEASALFARAIDALADMDEDAGPRLDAEDDAVDDTVSAFYTAIGRESTEIGLESAIELSRIGRYLERIADHGVNIGEHVTYIVTGEFPADLHPVLDDEDG